MIEKALIKSDDIVDTYRYSREDFLRYDCTELTFFALTWKTKGGGIALAEELMEDDVFDEDAFIEGLWDFVEYYGINGDGRIVRMYQDIELPWLGVSGDAYLDILSFDGEDVITAIDSSGGTCAVDRVTLDRTQQ